MKGEPMPTKGPRISQGQWVTLVQTCALAAASHHHGHGLLATRAVFDAMRFPCERVPLMAAEAAQEFVTWTWGIRKERPSWVPEDWAKQTSGGKASERKEP